MVPAVSTLDTMLPDIMPSMPLAKMHDLGGAAAERAAQRERQIDEELARAGHHQRGAEHQEADHRVGEGLDRNAEHALVRERVIGGRLLERRLLAAQRPEPARIGEQRIDRERAAR